MSKKSLRNPFSVHDAGESVSLDTPIWSSACQGQSTPRQHWSIVPSGKIPQFPYGFTLHCVVRVRRANPKLAPACLAKGFVDTNYTYVYVVVLPNIHTQSVKCPLTRLGIQLLILIRSLLHHPIPVLLCPVTYLGWTTWRLPGEQSTKTTLVIGMYVIAYCLLVQVKILTQLLDGVPASRKLDDLQSAIPILTPCGPQFRFQNFFLFWIVKLCIYHDESSFLFSYRHDTTKTLVPFIKLAYIVSSS